MSEFKNLDDVDTGVPSNRDYLTKFGEKLIENGYNIVPIQPGKKSPGFDGWQKSRATKGKIREWVASGYRRSGVGIITKYTPAIDIDVRDEKVAIKMEEWVSENIGSSPTRIGLMPKRLMVFKTDEPFKKMRSSKYSDEWGDQHQIEILGDGQQFVAYHIHPDTHKPYIWTSDATPLNTEAGDLLLLTVEKAQALIEYFESCATDEGWTLVKSGRRQPVNIDSDNPFVEDTSPINIKDDELRRYLLSLPNEEDYDEWVKVGMALYHQYDGDETGLRFWHEWSENADNYDADALDRKWKSFSVEGKHRAPITARYILKAAIEAAENSMHETVLNLNMAFLSAKTLKEWEKVKKTAQQAEIDPLSRSSLASIAKQTRDAVTGSKTPISEIKKAIGYTPKIKERSPRWSENWVYDVSDDRFYDTVRKILTSQQGFNAMYDREALTKKDIMDGRSFASSTASALTLNIYKIPVVNGRRYMPGRDPIFTENGTKFANTYPEHETPDIPEKLTPRDKRNVNIVKGHIQHMLSSDTERQMLLDWLSFVVQNPGKHANYSVLLQGVQGDGKTFFAEMMRSVMGVSNVTMLNGHILKSDFTDWAVGQCLNAIEEIRLINDKNKYEILNRVKPFITNNIIEIHPKGSKIYNALNTTNYMLFTNYKDALPLEDNERRYMILFSRWQKRTALIKFRQDNPDYYTNLYNAIEESPGAIRKWLLEHEQSEDFNAMGEAPDTSARQYMIRQAKPEFIQLLDELVLSDDIAEISYELLNVSVVNDHFMANGHELPSPKTMASMMQRDGYEKLGKVRFSNTEVHTVWSKSPELFRTNGEDSMEFSPKKIKDFVKNRSDRDEL